MKKLMAIILTLLVLFSAVSFATVAFASDNNDAAVSQDANIQDDSADDNDVYMGGFRCSMCDLFDKTKNDYFILNWLVAILHVFVHSIQARQYFNG